MTIRTATVNDLDALTAVEAACFPPEEAATREDFEERLKHFAEHFYLMLDGDRVISFVDGFVSDSEDITDDMYEDASLHDEEGAWQMVFGVNTLPEYRRRGHAGQLLRRMIDDARAQGRLGVILTCKEARIPWYSSFGFRCEGESASVHGGAVWYLMRLRFDQAETEQ